ncbi:MAG: hypothetical protein FJ083_01485, partial [Cyanobacteria bacterium K_Offshore_surface_m2_239]|nr:hypothetical protein [Cyanobacteria bacterium K_Offshore_surface_m2_239]
MPPTPVGSPSGDEHSSGSNPPLPTPSSEDGALRRLPRLLPVVVMTALTVGWAARPVIPVKVHGSGLLAAPESRRAFFARGPGEVQDIKVKVGEEVVPGQLLLTLSRVDQAAAGGGGVGPDPR